MLIPLQAVRDDDLPEVGAKALNLARMMRAGLPVPSGFCVTASVYRKHVDSPRLQLRLSADLQMLATSEPEDRRQILLDLRQAIISAPLPGDLCDAVQDYWRRSPEAAPPPHLLAVRSSATAEDLPGHSFAGQHDTFLGVSGLEGCLEAIRKCWASLWTERAFEYRARNGITHEGVGMAVIVQELVPAEASGVLFTADPVTGGADRLVIEACWGLGEMLVSGKVTPDRFVLAKADLTICSRRVGDKAIESVPNPRGGTLQRPLSPERAQAPALDDKSAHALARLATETEKLLGAPLDIEWALAGDRPYLLQARPITTLGKARTREDRQVWTNLNTGEVMPDVVTPMSWSVIEPLISKLLGQFFERLGMRLEGYPLFGEVAGRVYFNYNTLIAFARRFPGMGQEGITEMFGGRQDVAAKLGEIKIAEDDIPDLDVSLMRVALKLPGLMYDAVSFSPSRANAIMRRLRRRTDEETAVPLKELSPPQLTRRARAIVHELEEDPEVFALVGMVQAYGTTLYSKCRKWFGDDGNMVASRMLMGLGSNEIANAGVELWRLAECAHAHPPVEAAILHTAHFAHARASLQAAEGGDEFLQRWHAFMQTHGHHCRGELELMNPRWSETPDVILEQLKSYVRAVGSDDFLARYGRLREEREKAVEEALHRLHNPLRRGAFRFLVRKAQFCTPLRENCKSELVRRWGVIRTLLLELGERLTADGTLAAREDIFFLRLEELESVASGKEDRQAMRQRVSTRRAEYEANKAVSPPPVVVGRFDPTKAIVEEIKEGIETLTGVPVNPGVVTGPARVILRAGDDQVRPGEILVAPFTDPGWTPYFLNAAAIVTDMGGILSHGSIVAREFGIPAVVNVGPATRTIRTGQMIQVDGAKGIVRILKEGASACR